MPGTPKAPDKKPTNWTEEERHEFRKAVIEECLDFLDRAGYYGASRIMRRDLLPKD